MSSPRASRSATSKV
uniref:Uncharacterized protein n=1 Tax=Arundo donax TaxID=35708 RepID=A0A0A9A3V2_ARUDO